MYKITNDILFRESSDHVQTCSESQNFPKLIDQSECLIYYSS